jgi:DNA-binding NarL/FixJ family response regulator
VTNYDVCARAKSGQTHWINVSILAFPTDENYTSPLIVHLFRDVTQKKQDEAFIHQVVGAVEQLRDAALPPLSRPAAVRRAEIGLTEREWEILALLVQGHRTADIARSLSISPATARNHIQNILHKLHVHSRLEAVTYALEHGLVTRES